MGFQLHMLSFDRSHERHPSTVHPLRSGSTRFQEKNSAEQHPPPDALVKTAQPATEAASASRAAHQGSSRTAEIRRVRGASTHAPNNPNPEQADEYLRPL